MKNTLFITLSAVILMLSSCGSDSNKKLTDAELEAMAEAAMNEEIEKLQKEKMESEYIWQYTEDVDEMTSKKVKYAQVTSPDFASLDFPYEGITTMTLHVRESDRIEAFVAVNQGQLSPDYNNPTLIVKFDQNEPEYYSVSKEATGDSKFLFFVNGSKFVSKMKEADTTRIQCMFYDNGSHVYKFNTANFEFK